LLQGLQFQEGVRGVFQYFAPEPEYRFRLLERLLDYLPDRLVELPARVLAAARRGLRNAGHGVEVGRNVLVGDCDVGLRRLGMILRGAGGLTA
jgi:hypothetical protein